MRNVYYKVKYKDFTGKDIERIHTNLNEIKKDYNTLTQTSGISNVKLFIVNEIEEELFCTHLFS